MVFASQEPVRQLSCLSSIDAEAFRLFHRHDPVELQVRRRLHLGIDATLGASSCCGAIGSKTLRSSTGCIASCKLCYVLISFISGSQSRGKRPLVVVNDDGAIVPDAPEDAEAMPFSYV